ncbi:unnamed protein product [Gemmata massiliana]|uniref:Zinc-finger domain-containing protein n=1 Tax=Gemmata massiliana TaxID=1210884 RepID=A0A6P2CQ32_9BACT|nr:hypothetical protein [Gemmata massiliana]VTR91013.1 unnamed protein product [Gemmata massiliana]
MTCTELAALLVDYLNGELVIEHHETVSIHISGCKKCEGFVATYSHTVRVARALPKCCSLSPAFEARLRAALNEHLSE